MNIENIEKGKIISISSADSILLTMLLIGVYILLSVLFIYNVKIGAITPIGIIIGSAIFISVLIILGAALFLWIGAIWARIESVNFGDAFLAALDAHIGTWLTVFFCWETVGDNLGFILGLLLSIFIIKKVFNTNFKGAFMAWILYLLVQVLAFIILILTGAGSFIFKVI